ncbi:MAG: diguanylate cyclase, partial [Jatrophihabitantaceae bacterium]
MAAPPELANVRRSWLERLLDVVRELGQTSDLRLMLQRITEAAVDFLDFGAAAINLVEAGSSVNGTAADRVRVAAVAGPPQVRELLGQTSPLPYWLDLLQAAESWGTLRFFSHEQDQSLFDQIASWTPDATESPDPDAWHPDDALFAPLFGPDGVLLGILSVDQPASGRRPTAEQRTVLELFANQAAVAIADFQARQRSEGRRRDAEHRWEVAFERSPIGAAIVNPDGTLAQANASMSNMLGFPREQLVGMRFAEFTHPDDADADAALFADLIAGRRHSYETSKRYLNADGRVLFGLLHVGVIRDRSGATQSIVAQLNDITQRKLAEDQLAHRATHDALTELPNRSMLEQQLAAYLISGSPAGVLYCDLDRFKTVNDSLGHEAGDELLVLLARRLRAALPDQCILGRVGGDEFVALIPGEDDLEALRALAVRMTTALNQPLEVRGHRHIASVSIGITVGGPLHTHPDEVLREADLALLRAKRSGRSRIEAYDPT